jgi:hypothetical protein
MPLGVSLADRASLLPDDVAAEAHHRAALLVRLRMGRRVNDCQHFEQEAH